MKKGKNKKTIGARSKNDYKEGWGTTVWAGTWLELKLRVITIPTEGGKRFTGYVKVADSVTSWLGLANRYTGDYS